LAINLSASITVISVSQMVGLDLNH
jgi:hypothetical protein